jgi:selenophosphate synthetase-related protein
MTELTLESVGETREDAITYAIRILANMVQAKATKDYTISGVLGNASASLADPVNPSPSIQSTPEPECHTWYR